MAPRITTGSPDVDSIALRAIKELQLDAASMQAVPAGGYGDTWDRLVDWVDKLSREELFALAWAGKGEQSTTPGEVMYGIHCGTYLGKYDDGPTLIRTIATTSLAARLCDQLLGR